jgi:hypothetical protein
MKNKLFLLALISFILFSFKSTKINDDDKLKKKLVGSWSGSENDNQKAGLTKYWITNHNKNGTFIRLFTSIENCEVESHIEKGNWKVKDGLFYETFDIDGKTDIYKVEIVDDNNIKFIAKELSLDFNNKQYEFVETRQE